MIVLPSSAALGCDRLGILQSSFRGPCTAATRAQLEYLDEMDPINMDSSSLKACYYETTDVAIRGFILGLIEVRSHLMSFGGAITGMYSPSPDDVEFAGSRLLASFTPSFLGAIDEINPLSATAEELLYLASFADDAFSRAYCAAVMAMRAQICMIHPVFGDGLSINSAISFLPTVFPENAAQHGPQQAIVCGADLGSV